MPPTYTAIEILQDVWWIGVVAGIVSLVITPIVRFIAYHAKIVDKPDDLLKPHGKPVAYLGGIAMWAGLLAGLAAYITVMPNAAANWQNLRADLFGGNIRTLLKNPLWNLFGIALASTVIMIVGLIDDIREVKPKMKVLGQVLAAAVLFCGGVGYRMVVIIPYISPNLTGWIVVPISAFMLLVLVIAACNAMNLLDGLDGLCGGVTGIISLGFLALTVWLAMWDHFPGTDQLRVALCLAMAGGVIGFLPYNIPPASIFMGDAGSMLLGFFVAAMMAMFCQEASERWFIAACAIFALPILDTALAVVRRVLSGVSIFAGDRSHLYDQLVDRGMSVKQVVRLFYVLATAAALIGVGMAIFVRARYAMLIYAVLLVIIWIIFYMLNMIQPEPHQPSSAKKRAP